MGKKLTVRKRVIVDEGIYAAKVKSIEKKAGKFGDYYQITFKITDEEFEGKTINGNCPEEIEVGNKAYKWISILLGKELEVDDDIDIEDIVGKSCKVAVEHNSTDEGTFAKIVALYKTKKKSSDDDEEEEKPKKKKPADDEDEEEEKPKKKKPADDEDDEEEEEAPKKKKKVEDDDDDEDEEEEKPKKKKKDEDEDDDDDDEEFK